MYKPESVWNTIMGYKTIEKDAIQLHTPYCDFAITNEDGNAVCFDIEEIPGKDQVVYIDNDENKIAPIEYGAGLTLRIHTKNLELNQNYYIRPSVALEMRCRDERLYTVGITGVDFTFAVSFPDPNDDERPNPNFTEADYRYFNIEPDDGVYILRLYDREYENIYIYMYWIWNIHDHMIDYEDACEVATWW